MSLHSSIRTNRFFIVSFLYVVKHYTSSQIQGMNNILGKNTDSSQMSRSFFILFTSAHQTTILWKQSTLVEVKCRQIGKNTYDFVPGTNLIFAKTPITYVLIRLQRFPSSCHWHKPSYQSMQVSMKISNYICFYFARRTVRFPCKQSPTYALKIVCMITITLKVKWWFCWQK